MHSLRPNIGHPSHQRQGTQGWEDCENKLCDFFNLLPQAQTLFDFFTNGHPKPKFLCPVNSSQIYCFFV